MKRVKALEKELKQGRQEEVMLLDEQDITFGCGRNEMLL